MFLRGFFISSAVFAISPKPSYPKNTIAVAVKMSKAPGKFETNNRDPFTKRSPKNANMINMLTFTPTINVSDCLQLQGPGN